MFLSPKTPLLAIDIGANSIKLAQLMGSRDRFELTAFGIMPLEPDALSEGIVNNEEHVVDALSRLLKSENIETRHAIASVSGEAVIIKKIQVPVLPEEEIEDTINEEAEQYIPFDIDDVRIDYQILESVGSPGPEGGEGEEEKQEVLLVAVQNELIDNRAEVLAAAGLKPVIIDLDVFAAANAVAMARPEEMAGGTALIDLGAFFTHITLLLDGLSVYTRDVPIGGAACSRELENRFHLDYKETEGLKRGIIPADLPSQEVIDIIVGSFDGIVPEIQKSFEFMSSTSNSQVDRVFICGGGALIPGVDALMADRLNVPVEIFNPFERVKISGRRFDREGLMRMGPLASVAMGLAMRRFDYFEAS
ncbi:MAG: type IV pilus assembly protein PilM [Nitrospinaceae bacterium]